ncbi:WW domain-binding protein 1 isoform X2 [Octopus bimaculoides]|uniref:WW domain-binding protein 1 isoform X2 n=1 Tax=Octopus bimaculoides TaxID=37653 RepID=UPI00071E5090|nr:WW domain-binding protein 1 isoform X2 [Octopus bimaculoides]|eukprot:XP_014778552.1 PREDICTED: WW domain-binding protein 1-like isoform X2 [Octopus bimaculoides]
MFGSLSLAYGAFPLIFLNFATIVEASITCGTFLCTGNAYCCGVSGSSCCFYRPVYRIWWFWFVWSLIFLGIISCSYLCYKRKYRNNQIIRATRVYGPPPNQPGAYVVGPYQGYNVPVQPLTTNPVAPPPYKMAPPYTPN